MMNSRVVGVIPLGTFEILNLSIAKNPLSVEVFINLNYFGAQINLEKLKANIFYNFSMQLKG